MSGNTNEKKTFPKDDALPSSDQLASAKTASIFDDQGKTIQFSSILDEAHSAQLPVLLVFTRHFHCGMCKEFVKGLARSSALTDSSSVSVVVVGPGQPSGVPGYKAWVENPPFRFYADPELHLYHALGVTKRSLELGPGGSHHQESFTKNLFSSVSEIVKSGTKALQGGDFKQLGGEFVFNKQGEPVLAHRMQHTRDHTEISELERAVTTQA